MSDRCEPHRRPGELEESSILVEQYSRRQALQRLGFVVAAAPLGGILFAACNPDDEGSSGTDSERNASAAIAIGIGAEPRSLDGLTTTDGARDAFNFSVYETLVTRSPDGSEIVPLLAETWEADGNSWAFSLREGVKFHDGADLTANDMVESWKKMISPDSEVSGSFANVAEVQALDDLTLEIVSKDPDPAMPAKAIMVPIISAALISSGEVAETMMGTGRYKFVAWNRGQDIVLERNDDHWSGEQAPIREVTCTFQADSAVRLAALQAGEIQITRNMPPDLAALAPKVVTAPISEVVTLRMMTSFGPMSDKRVRQAAAYAINRQSIVDDVLGGFAEPSLGQMVAPFVTGFSDQIEEYPYDPDMAKSLLEEAGNTKPKIRLSSPTGRFVKDREIGEAIAGMLMEVGFEVDATFPEFSQWLEELSFTGANAPDIMYFNHSNDVGDADTSLASFATCASTISSFCNDKVDGLVAEARTELDPDARQAIYDEIWATIKEEAALVTICIPTQVHFIAENVEWTPRPDSYIKIHEISFS